jgi:hypothetical protein
VSDSLPPPYRRSLLLKLGIPAWILYLMGGGLHTLGVQNQSMLAVHLGFGLVGVSMLPAVLGAVGFFTLVVGGRDPRGAEVYPYALVGGLLCSALTALQWWGWVGSVPLGP